MPEPTLKTVLKDRDGKIVAIDGRRVRLRRNAKGKLVAAFDSRLVATERLPDGSVLETWERPETEQEAASRGALAEAKRKIAQLVDSIPRLRDQARAEGARRGLAEGVGRGRTEGAKLGEERGHERGFEQGLKLGEEVGARQGYDRGMKVGYERGGEEFARKGLLIGENVTLKRLETAIRRIKSRPLLVALEQERARHRGEEDELVELERKIGDLAARFEHLPPRERERVRLGLAAEAESWLADHPGSELAATILGACADPEPQQPSVRMHHSNDFRPTGGPNYR